MTQRRLVVVEATMCAIHSRTSFNMDDSYFFGKLKRTKAARLIGITIEWLLFQSAWDTSFNR